ncbi:MAG: twin-arginine translocation signal domain-containing protein [Chlorobi bacterium]|nr:twin-arginine translocation signal domain-containing protein [Chlorobiota bacterium]
MTNRRNFLKTTLVVAGGMAISSTAFAAKKSATGINGLIYSKDNAGMWAEKVGSHAPKVEVNGNKITLTTEHGMSERHYIVRHTLVAVDGEVIGDETFYPEDPKAVSTYELAEGSKGKYFATSFCNKHDFWVTEFEI